MKKRLMLLFICLTVLASTMAGCGRKKTESGKGVVAAMDTTTTTTTPATTSTVPVDTTTATTMADTTVPADTASSETATTQAAKAQPSYAITEISKIMYVIKSVNVRSGPGTDYEKVGSLSANQEVTVTGQADTGWYRIAYQDGEGFVSNHYLSDTKPETEKSSTQNIAENPSKQSEQKQTEATTKAPSRTYPNGNYSPGSLYGPKLTQAELDQVADAVQTFLATYDTASMDEYTKIETAHDYLCSKVTYAASWAENRANTAWGALVYGEAQCSGYARAMKALCDAMCVGCYYVHADENASNPSHQWNTVSIGGNWYIVDVQCNDSCGAKFAYLVSDEVYANFFGMSWDRSSIPACPAVYQMQ